MPTTQKPETDKIQVIFNHQRIALIFISINPNNENEKIASIVPIDRKGTWFNGDTTITLEGPFFEYYPADKPNAAIQEEITSAAAIEPWKDQFSPTPW